LLLLDLKLPGANGLEVLRWIRRDSPFPVLPVIVVTSSTLMSEIEAAYRSGANSCVIKPSDPEKLIQLIHDMSKWWLQHNVSPYNTCL
jgi:CheY-like chemotaxis protein